MSQVGCLEDRAAVRSEIEEAARHVDLDRLSVSPQFQFASVDAGNPPTMAEQEAKLRHVAETARDVWGST